ncbi:BMP family ABC transporter substrate-binding protein [Microbacterium excoecariae]|uniref:BMP family ABC transporter substrate-binding protein n=1 Tax=Microbacterium excoecariae TaxID=2715210 RepID=UPI00140C2138|nr:BMP family ABC transporter substrate-binding protein [Microbacterium excoecariae]NHI16155.1 BMP family ABC transporter substrate-binding protein [Microbacterium excoecariae]
MRFLRAATPLLLLAVLSGCGGGADPAPPTAGPALPADPVPGATSLASPPDADALASLPGATLAIVLRADEAGAVTMRDAAVALAADTGVDADVFAAPTPDADGVAEALAEALAADPDVVVGLGAGVVDVVSLESAQILDRSFLLVGAQVAEPTENVTAVVWDGATSRGSAASADGALDPATVTDSRARAALVAGLDAVWAGDTGGVILLSAE